MLTYTTIKNVPGYEQFKRNLVNMPVERIQLNIKKFDEFLSSNKKFFVSRKKDSRMNRDCIKEYRNLLNDAIETRYPQCAKENETRFVNENLPGNLLTTPAKKAKFNSLNETTNTNSKGDNSMKLNNAEITANIEQLTNKVNELLERIAVLEGRKTETHNFKKLRERKEAPKAEKVTAPTEKSEILKLQKKVREGEKTLTKKQLTQYNFFYGQEWRKINKTIDLNDKLARSMAFTKARLNCLKRAKTY